MKDVKGMPLLDEIFGEEHHMLSKARLVPIAASATGLPAYEVEAACNELTAHELTDASVEGWDPKAIALFYLRLTAPQIPIERFVDEISDAPLTGAVIDGIELTDFEQLASFKLTNAFLEATPLWLIEQHLVEVAKGQSGRAESYNLQSIAVCGSESGYCLSITNNWHGVPAGCAEVGTFLFGDAEAFLGDEHGRMTYIPATALTTLGEALKRASQGDRRPLVKAGYSDLMGPGSRLVH